MARWVSAPQGLREARHGGSSRRAGPLVVATVSLRGRPQPWKRGGPRGGVMPSRTPADRALAPTCSHRVRCLLHPGLILARGHFVPRQGRSLESRHVSHKADTGDVRRSPGQCTSNALLFYLVLLTSLAVGFPSELMVSAQPF